MSLTNFIKIPEVSKEILRIAKIPEIHLPPRKVELTTVDAAKMGTAMDYAIRFFLQNKYGAKPTTLIAELAVHLDVLDHHIQTKAIGLVHHAKTFMDGARSIDDNYTWHCWQLANLDVVYRQKIVPKSIPDQPTKNEANEIKSMMKLVIANWPIPTEYCLLNPTFGWGSNMVGGADADIVQDGCIIDIKTVKQPEMGSLIKQLVGYAVLTSFDGIDGAPEGKSRHVTHLAGYFSRHGHFEKWPIEEIISQENLENLAQFFQDKSEGRPSPTLDAETEYDPS